MIRLFVLLLVVYRALGVPPVFTGTSVDPVFDLKEGLRLRQEITKVTCDGGGRGVVISLSNVSPSGAPCSNCFQAFSECPGVSACNIFSVVFLPVGTFQYSRVQEYTLTFSCTNDLGEAAANTKTIHIRIVPNTPPFFGLLTSETVSGTKGLTAGAEIQNAQCTDADSDTIEYGLTTDPITDGLFRIGADGVIRAAKDLRSFCRSSIEFQVTCKDPVNAVVGPRSIHTSFDGSNRQPLITGINFNKDVAEDTDVGTTLGTFSVNDDDTSQTCRMTATPSDSLQYFSLDEATKSIFVKTKLNYEQTSTRVTNLTVTCTDGYCMSNPAFLYVRVIDVNEPIEISPKDFTLSSYEGMIDLDPKWTPIDEDVGDDPTYTIVGGNTNGRFAIHPTTGKITSTLEYDVDGGAMPTTETIVVQAKDEGGHTSTTTVTLTILDRNDNRPTFSNVLGQTFSVQECNGAGTSPGSLTATDADSDFQGNNRITYSGSSGPLTVGPNGAILIGAGITAGSTYTVQASARDAGEFPEALSSLTPATVTVTVTACPTQPPTTTAAPTTAAPATATAVDGANANTNAESNSESGGVPGNGGTPGTKTGTETGTGGVISTSEPNAADGLEENLGWIILAALLGTAFLAALGYMLWRTCLPYASGFCDGFGECCVVRETRRTTPIMTVKETYRGNAPEAGNRGFWQERYPDDDYRVRDPDRNRVPTPANYEDGNSSFAQMHEHSYSWRSGNSLPF